MYVKEIVVDLWLAMEDYQVWCPLALVVQIHPYLMFTPTFSIIVNGLKVIWSQILNTKQLHQVREQLPS